MYTEHELSTLKSYVENNDLEDSQYTTIAEIVKKNDSNSMIVYRGQYGTKNINNNVQWFSTSLDKRIAENRFMKQESGKKCCLFTIHLINVPILNINNVFEKNTHFILNKDRKSEKEIIVLGGGKFYKDEELKEEGFIDLENGEYECWYTFDKDKNNPKKLALDIDIDKLLNAINEDEYEFIDTKDDVKTILSQYELSDEDADQILRFIKDHPQEPSIGGKKRIKTKKKRKTKALKKRKTKRKTKALKKRKTKKRKI